MVDFLRISRLLFLKQLIFSFPSSFSLFLLALLPLLSLFPSLPLPLLLVLLSCPTFVVRLLGSSVSRLLQDFHQFSAQWEGCLSFLGQGFFLGEEMVGFLAFVPSKQTHKKQANQQPLALGATFSPSLRSI